MNNWAYNLDLLAQNNVIDFDGASYIKGMPPRYVGNPSGNIPPFTDYIPNPTNLQQPVNDEFRAPENDKNPVKNSTWKKCLFGALAVGAACVGIWKFKSISGWVKNQLNKLNWQSVKDFCIDKAKIVGNFFKKHSKTVKDFVVDKAKIVGNFFKKGWNKLFKKGTP